MVSNLRLSTCIGKFGNFPLYSAFQIKDYPRENPKSYPIGVAGKIFPATAAKLLSCDWPLLPEVAVFDEKRKLRTSASTNPSLVFTYRVQFSAVSYNHPAEEMQQEIPQDVVRKEIGRVFKASPLLLEIKRRQTASSLLLTTACLLRAQLVSLGERNKPAFQ